MSVARDEVRRIANLAQLDVDDAALDTLAEHMSRILEYVAQLQQVPAGETARPFASGGDALRLRPDEVKPWPLAAGPDAMAPAWRDGFFTVPRLDQFGDDPA